MYRRQWMASRVIPKLQRWFCCVAILAAQVSGALAQPLRFRANSPTQNLLLSGGLSQSFPARGVDSVDPLGNTVAQDVPRFDDVVSISAVPPYTTVVAADSHYLLAAGLDHNGTDELMLYL